MNTKEKQMRRILRGLLESAKSEAGDVLTDPTWNHDYLFGFKLTVSDLREIDRFLSAPSTVSLPVNIKPSSPGSRRTDSRSTTSANSKC